MKLKFFTFIIGTIFVGLVSGRELLAFNNPGDGGGYPYQQGNGGGSPQRNPSPYNPMNPQQPNNNGINNPANQPHNYPNNNGRPRIPQQPPHYPNNNGRNNPRRPEQRRQHPNNNGRNNPMYPQQPSQYPNNNGGNNPMNPQQPSQYPNNNGGNNPTNPQQPSQYLNNNGGNNPTNPQQPSQYFNNNGGNNPMNPQQPSQYPNNNGRNNPMDPPNPYQPTQYPNNGERNNPMNPANQYQPPQPPYNNGNNPPISGQQQPHRQMPNNSPPRPNMRRRNPNARPGFPNRPNGRNRRPQAETTQTSTIPIPLIYPESEFPPGFIEDMLRTLGLSVVPQSEEPTESSWPSSTIAETQPPMRNPHNRRPYQGPLGRRPGRRRKPPVLTTLNPSVPPETTFPDQMTAQVEENYVFPTETVPADVAKATPVVPDAAISETFAEEITELFTALQIPESSTQSNASKSDEIKYSDNEISPDIHETSNPEITTKNELEPVITTETATEKIATAETLSTSSALEANEIIEVIHVHAPEAEKLPDMNTSSPTGIPDYSEEIKTDNQPTTESPDANKDKPDYTQVTQTSVAEEKTVSESITSSLLPATTELSNEVITVDLTSNKAEQSTQAAEITASETIQATQMPLATTTVSTTVNEIRSVSSSAATTPSQSSSEESDVFDIKPGDSEFMPVFPKSPSKSEIVSTSEPLPKTTCYCTDGVTYVTTESLINIKKATTPIFTIEEAHTKYSEASNVGVTTPSYTPVLTSKETEEKGDITKSGVVTLSPTIGTLDTNANTESTQADSNTGATTPNIDDAELTTAPTVTSTASAVTSTALWTETTEPSDLTTEYEDENPTDNEDDVLHYVMNGIFDPNDYTTEIPPPGVTCRENQSYYKCIPNCRHTCLNYDNFDVPCPDICISGCSCNKGLVIDENNKCVKISECKDYTCKDDEDWWECMPKNHNTCDTFARAEAKQDFVCESGCFCMEGLIKAPDGRCVNPDKCPKPVCDGDHEVPTDCVNACNTCEAMCEKPNFCSFPECRPGCDCLGGYKRDANGTCVQAPKCPVCTTRPPSTTTTTIDTTTIQLKDGKTSPALLVETTPAQAVETIDTQEVKTTPAPEVETAAVQDAATIPAPSKVESAAAQEAETTPALSKVETTSAPSKVETTSSPSKVETTAVQKAETTPVETTSVPSKVETSPVETTSALSKVETAPAPSKAETTTPTAVDSPTLSETEKTVQTFTPVETTVEVPVSTTD